MIETTILKKVNIENNTDYIMANGLANQLSEYLNTPDIQSLLKEAHILNAPSQHIQDIFKERITELGFTSEKKGLFKSYQLRPDYFISLENGKGIILEVERGKTLVNNMDLLDLWKCHICKEANFLFLVIPILRPNAKGHSKVYYPVLNRLRAFFEAENHINVDAVFIFGY